MSGGHFEYKQFHIEQIADEVEQLIMCNGSDELDQWGYKKHNDYPPEVIEQFKLGLMHLRIAKIYAQRIDWLVSGDDGEDSFLRRLGEDLRKLVP